MKKRRDCKGFSTLEIMIALAIMVMTLTAVAQILFGNQKTLIESQMNAEALAQAQTALEQEEGIGKKDFEMVGPVGTTTDGVFQTNVTVDTWPDDLYTTKRVTANTSWSDESGVEREVTLTTLVTNYQTSLGGDTCDLPALGASTGIISYLLSLGTLLPWTAPLGHTFSTNNPIAALDAYQGVLAVAVASTSAKTNDKLFLFGITNPSLMPQYVGSINNATNTTDGIGAIRIAGSYAYVGSAHDPNFKTCKPSANCAQLQIFDISHPAAITMVSTYLLPTSTPPYVWGNVSSSNQAVGKSIFYANGYAYLGLSKTAHGPEFNIVDVHDPLHPVWVGGYAIGATISAVTVKNNYAYLATDDGTQDLVVLDVHDPSNPTLASIYNAPDPSGWSNGRSLSIIGETLFLGLTYATSSPELYELDISNPASIEYLAALTTASTVTGIASRSGQSYLVTSTTGQLQILDTTNTKSIATTSVQTLPGVGAALDCERGQLYAGSNSLGRGYLSVMNSNL